MSEETTNQDIDSLGETLPPESVLNESGNAVVENSHEGQEPPEGATEPHAVGPADTETKEAKAAKDAKAAERIKKLNEKIARMQAEIEADRAEVKRQESIIRQEQEKVVKREKEKWKTELSRATAHLYPLPVVEIMAVLNSAFTKG